MTNTIENIQQFKEQLEATQQFIHATTNQHKIWTDKLRDIDFERNDILHSLELGKGTLDAVKMIKLTTRLQEVLLERRKIKDMLEVIDGTKTQLALFTKNTAQIDKIVNTVNNVCERHKTRTYKVRRLHDLKQLLPNKLV